MRGLLLLEIKMRFTSKTNQSINLSISKEPRPSLHLEQQGVMGVKLWMGWTFQSVLDIDTPSSDRGTKNPQRVQFPVFAEELQETAEDPDGPDGVVGSSGGGSIRLPVIWF